MANGNDRPCAERPATRSTRKKDIPSLDDAFESVAHAVTQVRQIILGLNRKEDKIHNRADRKQRPSSVERSAPQIGSDRKPLQVKTYLPTDSSNSPTPFGDIRTQRNSPFIPTAEGSKYGAQDEISKRTYINNPDPRIDSRLQNPGRNVEHATANRPIQLSFPQRKFENTYSQVKFSSIPVLQGLNQNLNETFEDDNDLSSVDNPSPSESDLQHAQRFANFPTCSSFCPSPCGGPQTQRNSSFIPTNEGSKYRADHEMSKRTYINNHDPRNDSSLQNPGRNVEQATVNRPIRLSFPQEKVENTHPQRKSSSIPVVKGLNQNLNETFEHDNDNDLTSVDNPSASECELQHAQRSTNFPTCSSFCPDRCGGTQNQRSSSFVPTTEGSKYRTEDEMSKRTYINNPDTQIDSPLQNTGRDVQQATVNPPTQSSSLSENYENNLPQMTSSSIPVVWRLSLRQNETSAYADYNGLSSSADNVSPTSGNDFENMQRITSSPTRASPEEGSDSQQERNFQGITVVLGFDYNAEDNTSVGREINDLPSLADRLCPKSGNDLDQLQGTTNLHSCPTSSSSTEPQGNFFGIQLHYMIEEQPLLVDLNHLPSLTNSLLQTSESDRERVIADTNLQIISDDNPSCTSNNQPPDNSAATITHDTTEDKNSAFEGFNHFPSPTNNSLPKSDSNPESLQANTSRPKCPSVCPNANLPKCPSVCPNANLPKCPSVCPNANLPKCPSVCPNANLPKCPRVCPNVNPQHEGNTSGCSVSALPRAEPVQQTICPLAPCPGVQADLPRCGSWHDQGDGGVEVCTRRRARASRSIPSIEMSALDIRLAFKKSFLCLGRKLLQAAERGRADHIRLLLQAGADPNFTFGSQWTPLHRAARKGHTEVVALLLLRGADPMLKTASGLTALHVAAFNDYSGQCVTLLLDAGSDVRAANMSGRTALHYAAESGNMTAVRKLLAAGACKNARNAAGEAPLSVAKSECVRRLLR